MAFCAALIFTENVIQEQEDTFCEALTSLKKEFWIFCSTFAPP
jgi:hypothetical protein